VFSVVIYFWAISVCLTSERIEHMIGEVVIPEEEAIV
jgi:hypothetical protein